jgi:hypothetical protein
MLMEISNTTQRPGEPRRRWFQSSEQDLYLWENESGEIVGFQLCYSKSQSERALSWKVDSGLSHYRVDDGETTGRSKNTPTLSIDHYFDREKILAQFSALAATAPQSVVDFVTKRIQESPAAQNAI